MTFYTWFTLCNFFISDSSVLKVWNYLLDLFVIFICRYVLQLAHLLDWSRFCPGCSIIKLLGFQLFSYLLKGRLHLLKYPKFLNPLRWVCVRVFGPCSLFYARYTKAHIVPFPFSFIKIFIRNVLGYINNSILGEDMVNWLIYCYVLSERTAGFITW